jgi:cytochrome oxidase Cu insertion factor (SCO1/SenC/PrrC family)
VRTLAIALAVCAVACTHTTPAEIRYVHEHALAIGAAAPDVTVTQTDGTPTALADKLRGHKQTVVVFYRGFY